MGKDNGKELKSCRSPLRFWGWKKTEKVKRRPIYDIVKKMKGWPFGLQEVDCVVCN